MYRFQKVAAKIAQYTKQPVNHSRSCPLSPLVEYGATSSYDTTARRKRRRVTLPSLELHTPTLVAQTFNLYLNSFFTNFGVLQSNVGHVVIRNIVEV